jgi:hypothetical protein
MENPPIPNITSFVIRFVHIEPGSYEGPLQGTAEQTPACRGSVTHIQTNQEFSFTQWADAVAFIQRFVPIQVESPSDKEQRQPE